MIRALYSAASGMKAQELAVDNIAHNLANANTTGFKSRQIQFQDLLYQTMLQPGAAASSQSVIPTGLQIGLGTRPASNEINLTQGNFASTSNPLDVAIQGNGFFQVLQANGQIAYTRAGSFHLDRQGNVVTLNGQALVPQITIPPGAQTVSIASDGTFSYSLPGQTAAQNGGQIQLANFQNAAGLNSLGQNLYTPTDASGEATIGNPGGQEGMGSLLQGYTEQSNVSVVDEFVNLIMSQRTYEANSKVVTAADQMYKKVNSMTQ